MAIISEDSIIRRNSWVKKVKKAKGNFFSNSQIIEEELKNEISQNGIPCLLDHLRLCGNIPESYGLNTTEEKQYSKYTDTLLSIAYKSIGLKSIVINERADVADVEGYGKEFSFVADAKAFRLSRTAKNQKDFKVQAMNRWKHGKPFAMLVCPIYQLPSTNSQIYEQAIRSNVCIFTYSHLSMLVRYANEVNKNKAESLLYEIFKIVNLLNPSKSAFDYWLGINKTMLNHSKSIFNFWKDEKFAVAESIEIEKSQALKYLSEQREKIMKMSHDEALAELMKSSKIEFKIKTISGFSDNGLLTEK